MLKQSNYVLFVLPFMAMQDEGEEKTREQKFIEALGLSEEVRTALSDAEKPMDEVINSFKTGYSSILKETHLKNWDEEKRTALIKETQTGSHMAFQNKLLKEFGLDPDKFKDVDKKTEAIIKASKELTSKQLAELQTKLDGKTDATSKQLQEQLDLRNNEFKTVSEQLAELKKFKDDFPNIKEQIIAQERNHQWVSREIAMAHDKIENKNAVASLEIVELLLNKIATVEVKTDEKGNKTTVIKDRTTDAPFMRTATDNYKDVATFIKEKILVPNKLINLQNPASDPGKKDATISSGAKKTHMISKRAAERAK